MNQNYNSVPVSNTAVKSGINKEYILYGLMALAVLGCFLPFLTVAAPEFGYKESINYVYAADELKDGVYVIALIVAAFIGIIKKNNYKGAIVSVGLALGILAFDYFDVLDELEELSSGGLLDAYFGIGFYLVAIGLMGSFIMAMIVNKNSTSSASVASNVNVMVNTMPQPMPQPVSQPVMPQAQVMPQQPLTCSYCGGPRNDGLFCKSCGGKY